MTYSSCWLEIEDSNVTAAVEFGTDFGTPPRVFRRLQLLPDTRCLQGGGVYGLRNWAAARNIAVEYGADPLDIAVQVSSEDLLSFLDLEFRQDELAELRARITDLPDSVRYRICAEEF